MEVGITVTCLFCTASSRFTTTTEMVVVTVVVAVEVLLSRMSEGGSS